MYITHKRAYRAWVAMRFRCLGKNSAAWKDYGGRGITFCKRWESFDSFLADMGDPLDGMTLDRINNDGNYEPANCRWATRAEQAANRRNARLITVNGITKSATEWARQNGFHIRLVSLRLSRGWNPIAAVSTPPRRK